MLGWSIPRLLIPAWLCVLTLAGCAEAPNDTSYIDAVPVEETPAPKTGRTDQSGEIMQQMGQCVSHTDCAQDQVCAAVAPGRTECIHQPDIAAQVRQYGSSILPPYGVVDGSVRQFAGQDR